ncbi:Tyrosine-protein phosphatase [Gryllus bimaculatus]|nr:Tyrosine-protein phosphatase [Gryllus bimaculatus]
MMYYPRQRITSRGVQYRKLSCAGHAVPSEAVVEEFCAVVKEFQQARPGSRALIGVHCTHGLNRTGFLVCSYMIRRLGFAPADAIAAFEAARGHRIERPQLVARLHDMPRGDPGAPCVRRANYD